MLYKFDKNRLEYKKASRTLIILKYIGIVLGVMIVFTLFQAKNRYVDNRKYTEEELIIIINDYNEFSKEKLIEEIRRRNFKFPYIVYAQAILETGEFTSDIFKHNHNLFGMREARMRINTAVRTERYHAYYNNWRESLEDYGYYYSSYLRNINTENEYYDYLSQYYAEAENYVESLKRIIDEYELKKVFDVNE
jgi:uncharacterized FlgJ-related protein